MQRVLGYIRVSHEEQVRDGWSLSAQREKIELYCRMNDMELIKIEADEDISAKSLNRPRVKRVLEIAERGEVYRAVRWSPDRASVRDMSSGITT